MGKMFLIWLDILGFENLAEEIAGKTHLTERKVRADFISVIKEKVAEAGTQGEILGENYGERDDWILATNSLELVFKAISRILEHNTEYEGHEKIPLEIAIGIGEYDKWARFDGAKLSIEKPTIQFLKTRIIGFYHEWYRQNHNNKSPTSTFIVLTESAHQELEPLDKKICRKIRYRHKKNSRKKGTTTFFVAGVDKVQQRGKMFEFLEKIKRPGSKLYDRIDDLYIPPLEYGEIKQALETDRLVFITGTREYGKTYTAVRLLWEYFNEGCEPAWRKGGEEWERGRVRERLEEIERELKPNCIIYFEDPFGKARYERRESLEREIGTIIECVGNVEDVYVVITSREEVFKEFERENLSSVELIKFEKKLNIKKPSYNYQKRKRILLKWAESKECKWLKDEELKGTIVNSLKNRRKLSTPLSIKDFVTSTISIAEADKLLEKIEEKSKETARSFAKEIKNMTDDKILFLLFPFINAFPIDFVASEYVEFTKFLKLKKPWSFDRILNWFKDDKVAVSDRRIEFSHPSYSEAIEHLLVEKGRPTRINEGIFIKLLFKLSYNGTAVGPVANAVATHFSKLPQEVRNRLLLGLSIENRAAGGIARAVVAHFGELPESVRNLLFELSERPKAAPNLAWPIAAHFHELPDSVRRLLHKLSGRARVAWAVAWALAGHYGKLPDDVRRLLYRMAEGDKTAGRVANAVAAHFDKLPEDVRNELLIKVSEKEKAAGPVARAVARYYGKLPENTRRLLFRLAEGDKTAEPVAKAFVHYYDKLPEGVRNRLLLELSEKESAAGAVAGAVMDHFDELPGEVRKLVFKLSERDDPAGPVAKALVHYYNKLPEDVRNELIIKLSEKDKAAGTVAGAIVARFDELPREVRKLVFKLSEKDAAAGAVASSIVARFDELPGEVRKLVFKLSEKDSATWSLAWAIVAHFKRLPEDVENLLHKLSDEDRGAEAVAWAVAAHYKELPEDARRLLINMAEKDRVAWTVVGAVVKHFDELPEGVRNRLLLELSEKESAAGTVAKVVEARFNKLTEDLRNELLNKLSKKDITAKAVAWAIVHYFKRLPEDVRNELLNKLSKKDITAKAVAWAIGEYSDKLPKDVRDLLHKLSEKDETAGAVIEAVASHYKRLPEDMRILLFKLSDKESFATVVARAVATHYKVLPEDVRNLLFKLQDPLQKILTDLSSSHYYASKMKALKIISKVKPKLNEDFTLGILNRLVKDQNENVKIRAQELMDSIGEKVEKL